MNERALHFSRASSSNRHRTRVMTLITAFVYTYIVRTICEYSQLAWLFRVFGSRRAVNGGENVLMMCARPTCVSIVAKWLNSRSVASIFIRRIDRECCVCFSNFPILCSAHRQSDAKIRCQIERETIVAIEFLLVAETANALGCATLN